jgi:hypothetical protein
MPQKNDLADGLVALERGRSGGTVPKVLQLFGDNPKMLEAIRTARRDNHLSYAQIASYLTRNGHGIGEGAIKKWLDKEGIA